MGRWLQKKLASIEKTYLKQVGDTFKKRLEQADSFGKENEAKKQVLSNQNPCRSTRGQISILES
jgi:hypothetical protein